MGRIANWGRKHTLILVFLVMVVAALYALGYQRVIVPLAEAKVEAEERAELAEANMPTAEDIALFESAVPEGTDAGDVIGVFSEIAAASGAQLLDVTELTEAEAATTERGAPSGPDLGVARYSIQVVGDSSDITNTFMDGVKASPRGVQIDSIRLMQDEEVRLDMQVSVYYQESSKRNDDAAVSNEGA